MSESASNIALVRANRRLRVLVWVLSASVLALSIFVVVNSFVPAPRGTGRAPLRSSGLARLTEHREHRRRDAPRVPAPPRLLVGVTTGGVLETLDPATGASLRTLATGVTGDELSVSPGGSTVYFEEDSGCMHEIESVPTTGGAPQLVTDGSVPALSPDGTELAYVRQPLVDEGPCQGAVGSASMYTLVIRSLATGQETTYPVAPPLAGGPPNPIDHLSWSFDGQELAVSTEGGEGDDGWQLALVRPSTDDYYFTGSGVPMSGQDPSVSYYREGVFMPDGDLFVNRVCCDGPGSSETSTLMLEVDPSTGKILHQVAIGILGNDHTSLESDPSGHWLLYLSGDELLVSENGHRPTELTSGLSAAAW